MLPFIEADQREVMVVVRRWHNQLSPSINKSEWTEEEEAVIFAQHRVFGNRWKEIAKELDNR